MAETSTPTRKTKDVEQIDFSKPFWITIHQSRKKTNVRHFQGENAEPRALAYASERASSLNRPVAVMGPQVSVKIKPPVATAADMPLAFAKEATANA